MPLIDPVDILAKAPVIPVLTIDDLRTAVPLAQALVEGGLPAIEVTLRTDAALEAIRQIADRVPGAIAGAGTITSTEDIDKAVAAGARFLVSPGTPAALAEALSKAGVPVLPGCATASEALALASHGFRILKFFPAEASGGTGWLKAVAAPLPKIAFCPTGGIGPHNAAEYLALPNVVAVGGSWVAPADAVKAGDYSRIRALAGAAAALRPAA